MGFLELPRSEIPTAWRVITYKEKGDSTINRTQTPLNKRTASGKRDHIQGKKVGKLHKVGVTKGMVVERSTSNTRERS